MAKKSNYSSQNRCVLCGRTDAEVPFMLQGIDGYICSDCAKMAAQYVAELEHTPSKGSAKVGSMEKAPKPKEIKDFLDQYVIGQDRAKTILSVAVYNHYKRISHNLIAKADDDVELEKSNILLVGPTGTGKTLLAKTIARLLDVPFTIVDATVLTEAGYVGEDVESLLTRLLQEADFDQAKAERGIVFIDEIDKIASSSNSGSNIDVSREGVQRDILPIVEGTKVSTKYGVVDTTHILFIASGAFHVSKPSDLIPELQGRFPLRVELDELKEADFYRILTEPSNAITKQYQQLLATEGVNLVFNDEALHRLAQITEQMNTQNDNIGARRLFTIMEKLLEELSFAANELSGQTVTITREYVDERLKDVLENQDLSRYIL